MTATDRLGAQPGESGKPQGMRVCALLSKADIQKPAGARTPRSFDQIDASEAALGSGSARPRHQETR